MTGPFGPPPGRPGPPGPSGPPGPPTRPGPPGAPPLRRAVALAVDLGLTVAGFAAALVLAGRLDGFFGTYVVVTALLGAAAVALLNRVILQRITAASVGKLLTGLAVVDLRTGRTPTVVRLLWAWFATVLVVLVVFGDSGSDVPGADPFPYVLTRADLDRMRNRPPAPPPFGR